MERGTPIWTLTRQCKIGSVRLTKQALNDARDHYGFLSAEDVVRFIAQQAFDEIEFIDTKPLEWNPEPFPVDVHAYRFRMGRKEGYLAFYFGDPSTVIKSLHPERFPPKRSMGRR